MLVLKRKTGESFSIQPCSDMDSNLTVREVLGSTPIQVVVDRVAGDAVKVGVVAHSELSICWDEMYYRPGRIAAPSETLSKNAHVRQILGANICQLRTVNNISGKVLANKANLSVTMLSAIELGIGIISLDELVRLALALNVDVSRLLQEPVNHTMS